MGIVWKEVKQKVKRRKVQSKVPLLLMPFIVSETKSISNLRIHETRHWLQRNKRNLSLVSRKINISCDCSLLVTMLSSHSVNMSYS